MKSHLKLKKPVHRASVALIPFIRNENMKFNITNNGESDLT